MKKEEKALETFSTGLNCAQSVLSSFAGELGLEADTALKIAAGFGGGMGGLGGTCGAVTGAFMVIGLTQGHSAGEDKAGKEATYALVRQFAADFSEKHGSILCRELLGHDVSTARGYRDAAEGGVFKTLCPRFVKGAVQILQNLL